MHYIAFSPTKMNDVSGISVTKYALSPNFGEQSEWEDLVKICKNQMEQRYSLQLVYGSAGTCKSFSILSLYIFDSELCMLQRNNYIIFSSFGLATS